MLHMKGSFEYNYEARGLKENRFSDEAVLERIYQKFGDLIVQNEFGLFCFDAVSKRWNPLELKDTGTFTELYNSVILDILHDEHFLSALCVDSKGNPSFSKKQKAQEHFLSGNLYRKIAEKLICTRKHRVKYVSPDTFDSENSLLMVKNGVLNLVTGELREPQASDYIIGCSPVEWQPHATCDRWLEFLNEVFEESSDAQEMIDFLQQLFGYTISGDVGEQKIFCHYGTGANGKSKVLSALKMLGGNLSVYVAPDDFSNLGSYGTKFERFGSKAKGKRVVIVDDLEVGGIWNESLVKAVTANYFMARNLYTEAIEVKNQAAFHIGLNEPPTPQAENFGLLRRICLIPYLRQFDPDQQSSKRIDAMIKSEISGILKWAQVGYAKLSPRGTLPYPKEVDLAVEEYKEEHFILHNVVRELYEIGKTEEEFRFYYEIEADIKQYLQEKGNFKKVSHNEITSVIRQIFKVNSVHKWAPDRKNAMRGVPLKLTYKFNNPKNVF